MQTFFSQSFNLSSLFGLKPTADQHRVCFQTRQKPSLWHGKNSPPNLLSPSTYDLYTQFLRPSTCESRELTNRQYRLPFHIEHGIGVFHPYNQMTRNTDAAKQFALLLLGLYRMPSEKLCSRRLKLKP